jgi:hypothetical protein
MSIDRDDVVEGARQAKMAQGFHKPADMYEAIFEVIEPAVATNLKARGKAALHRDKVMSSVFSLVEAPAEIEEDDPEGPLKKLVYKELNKKVWETTAPLSGKMQQLMETRNGYVVCRLGGLTGDHVYVTADEDCFRVDVIESRSSKDIASVTKLAMFYGRVSRRLPQMAPMIAASFEESLQGVLAAGRAHIPLLQGGESEKDE